MDKGTRVSLESNGTAIMNNNMVAAAVSYDPVADGGGRDDAWFTIQFSCVGAPTAGSSIDLLVRVLEADGTNDASAPLTNWRRHYLGSFPARPTSGEQIVAIPVRGLPPFGATLYLHNNGTGQIIAEGWKLSLLPVQDGLPA